MSDSRPPRSIADLNLLFGILALQLDFVSRDALVAAMQAWVFDKARPLGDILQRQGALTPDRHALLAALVEEHLRQHGNDAERSLAAVSSVPSVRDRLRELADPDLEGSLAHLAEPRDADPNATHWTTLGTTTSTGVRFRVVRPHAEGGLGRVLVAIDEEFQREVALKEIKDRYADHAESRSRFLLEAEVTGGLEHPGIVPVYGLGKYADGRPFYAMRFIQGDSLKEAIERFHRGPARPGDTTAGKPGRASFLGLELRQLLGRFVDVCQAIAYAHSRGILHRDLKPGNIMLGRYGETLVVDWGLAKPLRTRPELGDPAPTRHIGGEAPEGDQPLASAPGRTGIGESGSHGSGVERPLVPPSAAGSAFTQMGSAIGTPQYMSPEQAAGRVDELGPASDIYSLGATLYCLLTGRVPFPDRDLGTVLGKVQRGDFPPPRQVNSRVPAALEAICLRAMAVRPADRYPSCASLADDVERWLADEPVSAYREPWLTRWARWARRHKPVMAGAGALVLTALVALSVGTLLLSREQARTRQALRERALGEVETLLDADPHAVPTILDELRPFDPWIIPRLRELRAQPGLPAGQRERAALALLAVDPGEVGYLRDRLLDCPTEEFPVIRDRLKPYQDLLLAGLWQTLHDERRPAAARLHAGMALAVYAPHAEEWREADGRFLARQLVMAQPDEQAGRRSCLRPVRRLLLTPLQELFRTDALVQVAAAAALADLAQDDPELLARLAAEATPEQCQILYPALAAPGTDRDTVVRALGAMVREQPGENLAEAERVRLGKRRAGAAIALVRLGQYTPAWEALRVREDPEALSQFVHGVRERGLRPADLLRPLARATEERVRFALLLSLGEFAPDEVPAEERGRLTAQLLDWYRNDPSSAIHGAAGWLLRTWGLGEQAAMVDHTPLPWDPTGNRQWFVCRVGDEFMTFIVFEPGEFLMGSPSAEEGRAKDEPVHAVRLSRRFAICDREVTVGQWRSFLRATNRTDSCDSEVSPTPLHPVNNLDWLTSTEYCRWLTRQAGTTGPYLLVKNAARGDGAAALEFRLPTEAEWEFACRCGTRTPYAFGSDKMLLGDYAWFVDNAHRTTHPCGDKRPNLRGLFDMHGNVMEWCQDWYGGYAAGEVVNPAGPGQGQYRVLRGGNWGRDPNPCRSADRSYLTPGHPYPTMGLRVVCPLEPAGPGMKTSSPTGID
jgi:formylglycine-generating enzyme required for sulfatase activity/serine/threonine protein kinase